MAFLRVPVATEGQDPSPDICLSNAGTASWTPRGPFLFWREIVCPLSYKSIHLPDSKSKPWRPGMSCQNPRWILERDRVLHLMLTFPTISSRIPRGRDGESTEPKGNSVGVFSQPPIYFHTEQASGSLLQPDLQTVFDTCSIAHDDIWMYFQPLLISLGSGDVCKAVKHFPGWKTQCNTSQLVLRSNESSESRADRAQRLQGLWWGCRCLRTAVGPDTGGRRASAPLG